MMIDTSMVSNFRIKKPLSINPERASGLQPDVSRRIDKIRIGVLMGGSSSERKVSLKSGKAVCEALKSLGLEAVAIDIQREDRNYVKDLLLSYDIGLAFLALHGAFGEDGRIQAILEEMGLAYTGSGTRSSALAMDKLASRRIFEKEALNVPRCVVLERGRRGIGNFSDYPAVVKPVSGGSSIGLSIVDNPADLKLAVELAFKYDRKIMIEEYIPGREFTVGILDNLPLEAIEIKPKSRFFDYKAKYEDDQTEYIVPARVPLKTMQALKSAALRAHNGLGCFFFSRADIILSNDSRLFVLEVNTIPGFTSTSLLPKAALCEGITFPELVLKITHSAWLNRQGNNNTLWPEEKPELINSR